MPASAARPQGSAGENILHFNGIRIRVNGEGELDIRISSLQDVRSRDFVPLEMANPTDIIPFKKTNFITQRAAIKCSTDVINEYFRINRIIIYTAFFGTEYPS